LTGRERTRAVLAGGGGMVFAPLAWSGLPAFVHAPVTGEFWLDPGVTQRMLGDAAVVCAADALAVPLLPRLRSPGAHAAPGHPDDVAGLPDVLAVTSLVGRLAATGAVGQVGELPTLGQLGRLLPGAAAEDTEDALSDLARAALEAGADAVAVRGEDHEDVRRTVDAIASLAGFYGAPTLGVAGERAWAADDSLPVGVLRPGGSWPGLPRGLILTSGDITGWGSAADVRALLPPRGEAV